MPGRRCFPALLAAALAVLVAHAQAQGQGQAAEPGCAWVRTQGADAAHFGAEGAEDLATARPIDAGTRFNIASVSKQFTALAILLLAEDRVLDLDDSIGRHLPELAGELRRPTLQQALMHRGGLPDYIDPLERAGRATDAVSAAETLELLAGMTRLRFAPGSRFEYSNTGYFLLAQVVQRATGQTLAHFSARRIFAPLGMHATTIVDRYPAALDRLARGYRRKEQDWQLDESSWEQTGDGQVHTTAADMGRWLVHVHRDTALARADGSKAPGVRSLLLPRAAGRSALAAGRRVYANGWEQAMERGEALVSHGGGWAGYASFWAYAPGSGRGAAVLCNRSDAQPRQRALQLLSPPR
jgi:CubicO group peptidase (beta-lactamase class C family)